MKKALLAAVLLLVSMLGAIPAQAVVVENDAPMACEQWWYGIYDTPQNLDSHRWVNLRSAWLITECNGTPITIQTYLAVTCKYKGQPQACSFSWQIIASDNGVEYENRWNSNPNTGSDGFASTYGPPRQVVRCHTYSILAGIFDPGIAGVVFDDAWFAHPLRYNPCA